MARHRPFAIFAMILLGLFLGHLQAPTIMAEARAKGTGKEILAIGTGLVSADNVAKARDMALSEALVKAVETYLSRRLGSQGMINYFPRLLQDVLPRAREEVENFNILAEERLDGLYKILVRVKVNEKLIEERLREMGVVFREGPPIGLLFLVSQWEQGADRLSYWWQDPVAGTPLSLVELALYRVFQDRGFRVVNRLLKAPEGEFGPDMKALDLTEEAARRWGTLFAADVVVLGRCEIREEGEISLMLRALHVENGMNISQGMERVQMGEGPGGMEQMVQSIEAAASKVAKRLSPEIMMAMELSQVRVTQLPLKLRGLRSFRQFRIFREFLMTRVPGVKAVKQTRLKGNSLSLSIEYLGDTEKFLNKVSRREDLPFEADLGRTEEGEIIVLIR